MQKELKLLEGHIQDLCPYIHSNRLKAVMDVAEALHKSRDLKGSSLGRNMAGSAKTKHKIKKVDRLEGNSKLHSELDDIYSSLSKYILMYLKNENAINIVIDLCYLKDNSDIVMLSAEIALKGRTLPIYRKAFKANEQRGKSQGFLESLKQCLPSDKEVIIIMDAGFSEEWLRNIELLNWKWLIRVRGTKSIKLSEKSDWQTLENFRKDIATGVKSYNKCILYKTHSVECRIVTSFDNSLKRKRPKKLPGYYNAGKGGHSASSKEPWILATNMSSEYESREIVNIYKKRMQIEESFRDLKSHQYGLRARYIKSENLKRWGVKLLIASIVQVTLWIIGVVAYHQGFQKEFQPNTTKKKVFSYFFLGTLMVQHDKLDLLNINYSNIDQIIKLELGDL
ncbi:MAG: IS4 family transposase [Candidatus Rhabdochlamydia sp.]